MFVPFTTTASRSIARGWRSLVQLTFAVVAAITCVRYIPVADQLLRIDNAVRDADLRCQRQGFVIFAGGQRRRASRDGDGARAQHCGCHGRYERAVNAPTESYDHCAVASDRFTEALLLACQRSQCALRRSPYGLCFHIGPFSELCPR